MRLWTEDPIFRRQQEAWRDPWLPAVCDLSVTNVCNAACDFCGFARDKMAPRSRKYIDADALKEALPILHRRGIRYMTLQGGEPLIHPHVVRLVSDIAAAGIQPAIITNGWFLPRHVEPLCGAGLRRLIISIDSAEIAAHERNRGLEGLSSRIKEGVAKARNLGVPVCASVTVSRLLCYEDLPDTLHELGFEGVEFSYPRRDALGSSSLVYSEQSCLIDLSCDELLAALCAIRRVGKRFPVFNSTASLREIARFVRGERQHIPCVGGYKYFYLDWNLNIWRCEAWNEPMGSVFDLDRIPDRRDVCNACMMACYRNASILMHAGIAASDSLHALSVGHIGEAAASLFRRSVALSLWALVEETPQIKPLAGRRRTATSARRCADRDH